MQKLIDLAGNRYGNLTVIRLGNTRISGKSKLRIWDCRCDCGNFTSVRTNYLLSGHTLSCGCLRGTAKSSHAANRKHGMHKSITYHSWCSMKKRCNTPGLDNAKSYYDLGIKVCERWEKFENFLADMGERPSKEMTIDRIDGDGHYERGNCRWATKKEQCENRKNRMNYPLMVCPHCRHEYYLRNPNSNRCPKCTKVIRGWKRMPQWMIHSEQNLYSINRRMQPR